jgi:hypothetical protein
MSTSYRLKRPNSCDSTNDPKAFRVKMSNTTSDHAGLGATRSISAIMQSQHTPTIDTGSLPDNDLASHVVTNTFDPLEEFTLFPNFSLELRLTVYQMALSKPQIVDARDEVSFSSGTTVEMGTHHIPSGQRESALSFQESKKRGTEASATAVQGQDKTWHTLWLYQLGSRHFNSP